MTHIAQAAQTSCPGDEYPRRRFFRHAALATTIAGVTAVLGIKAFAHASSPRSWRRGPFWGGAIDPAAFPERLDRMLRHLYVEIDATDAQQGQLGPIVKSAAADLLPLRARMRDARRHAIALLAEEQIDRSALEALRAEQLQLADEASRRITQALADAADVLTPGQRKQLAERVGRWHGHRG